MLFWVYFELFKDVSINCLHVMPVFYLAMFNWITEFNHTFVFFLEDCQNKAKCLLQTAQWRCPTQLHLSWFSNTLPSPHYHTNTFKLLSLTYYVLKTKAGFSSPQRPALTTPEPWFNSLRFKFTYDIDHDWRLQHSIQEIHVI